MPTFGLFGGSFNPPHVGHLAVAEACADAAGLDAVVWMPAATPPHKRDDPALAPAAVRLEMVRAAVAGNDRFRVSDLEVRRADATSSRPAGSAPSYTVDALRALAAGGDDWALIVGGDSLASFAGWREPREIVRLARLLVYRRPGSDLGDVPDWALDRTTVVDGPALDLSATALRARVAAGRSVRYLVADGVREVIARRGLYRDSTG